MHRDGIVHGDVNPANIVWFDSESAWKLTNLERACRSGEEAPLDDCCHKYAPPEILQALTEDKRAIGRTPAQDVWSFGRIVCEMCTGDLPLPSCRTTSPAVFSDDSVLSALSLEEGMRSQVERSVSRGEASQRWRGGQREDDGLRFIESLLRADPDGRKTSRQILDDDFLRPDADNSSRADASESVCFADRC